MKSFQQRTLESIERMAEDFGLECTQSASYGNAGQVNLHIPDSHVPLGFIAYDFQSSTYKLSITINGRKIPSQVGRADYFDFYQDNDKPTRFWHALEHELTQRNNKFSRVA